MDNPIDDFIIRFLSHQESGEDIQLLKKWLNEDISNKEQLKEWLHIWDATDIVNNQGKYDADAAYHKFLIYIEENEDKPNPKRVKPKSLFIKTLYTIGKIAAVFILSFSLGAICFYYYSHSLAKENIAYIENIIPLGSKSEIKLPDGSIVVVNAGSKLRYPTNFGETSRDIYLEGEGYFKVAKDEKRTFIVHTSLMNVRALGTEFNVKAYPEEEIVETTLISGEVAIESGTIPSPVKKPVLLKPGQKYSVGSKKEQTATLKPQTPYIPARPQIKQLSPDVANAEVSWKEKNWRIEKEKLRSLAIKLERRYDVEIKVDEKLLDYHFTSTLKDESLEQVLRAMQSTAPILYKVEGKSVTILADRKKIK